MNLKKFVVVRPFSFSSLILIIKETSFGTILPAFTFGFILYGTILSGVLLSGVHFVLHSAVADDADDLRGDGSYADEWVRAGKQLHCPVFSLSLSLVSVSRGRFCGSTGEYTGPSHDSLRTPRTAFRDFHRKVCRVCKRHAVRVPSAIETCFAVTFHPAREAELQSYRGKARALELISPMQTSVVAGRRKVPLSVTVRSLQI